MKKLTHIIIILLFLHTQLLPMVHVFGDSHASFCFSDKGQATHIFNYKNIDVPFSIHWLIGKTMYGVSKNGLDILNIKKFNVQEYDIAVFAFGEIDVRCHIGKQRDEKGRDVHEIIDSLVTQYMKFINQNRALYKNIFCIVMEIIPPSNRCNHPNWPFYGTLEDRIAITRLMNKRLREACNIHHLLFLPTHNLYANPGGSLNAQLSDNCVHVGYSSNYLIKQQLIDVLLQEEILP